MQNAAKKALRRAIQAKLDAMPLELIQKQTDRATQKLLSMDAYKNAGKVSVYLSTTRELGTMGILRQMFTDGKQVFVPTYRGDIMEMVQLNGMDDYESLPMTKWNIKQPSISDSRPNALESDGLDLILLPGVAFTTDGGRCGHGRGYYDKYVKRHFDIFPERYASNMPIMEKVKNRKTVLIGLALNEQIVEESQLPLDEHDFPLDLVLYDRD